MINFSDAVQELMARGYREENVEEKLAQDILLKALSESGFKDNVTIKGGVVMANLTKDIRRTTMDLDIDFMHYSSGDETARKADWNAPSVARIARGEAEPRSGRKRPRAGRYSGRRSHIAFRAICVSRSDLRSNTRIENISRNLKFYCQTFAASAILQVSAEELPEKKEKRK